MRSKRSVNFPYKIFKGTACPIVPVEIAGYSIDLYVDSGAFVSILTVKSAESIGIEFQKGRLIPVTVGDGNTIPVYLHELPVKIAEVSFKATIGISDKLGVGFNLLGRKDVFERFIVSFDDRRKLIRFLPNRI